MVDFLIKFEDGTEKTYEIKNPYSSSKIADKVYKKTKKKVVAVNPIAPSKTEYFVDKAKKGIAETIQFPADVAGATYDQFNVVGQKFADQIKKSTEGMLDIKNYETDNPLQQIIGKGVQFVGGGLPLNLISILTSGGKIGKGLLVDGIVDAFQGAAAETGGDIAEALDAKRQTGEIVSTFPSIALSGVVTKSANKALGMFEENKGKLENFNVDKENLVRSAAGEDFQKAFDAEAEKNLDEALMYQKELKKKGIDVNLTAAQATDEPTIKEVEKFTASKTQVDYNVVAKKNIKGINDFKNQVFPEGSLEFLAKESTARNAKQFKTMEKLDKIRRKAIEKYAAKDKQNIGNQLFNIEKTMLNVAKQTSNKNYEDTYKLAEKNNVTISSESARSSLTMVGEQLYTPIIESLPPVYKKLISRTGGVEKGGQLVEMPDLSFKEWHQGYKEINKQLRKTTDAADASKLNTLRKEWEKLLPKDNTEVMDSFKAANTYYRTIYVPTFRQGVGGKINNYMDGKGNSIMPSKVVEEFVKSPENADQFLEIYQDNNEAMRFFADGVIQLVYSKAVKDGVINQNVFKAQIQKLESNGILSKFPIVKEDLTDLATLTQRHTDAIKRVKDREAVMKKDVVSSFLDTDNPVGEIAKVLDKPKEMQKIYNLAKTDADRSALMRVVVDAIEQKVGKDGNALEFLVSNPHLRSMAEKLGKDYKENLGLVAIGFGLLPRIQFAKGVTDDLRDPIQKFAGIKLSSFFGRLRAMVTTKQSPTYFGADLLREYGINLTERQFNEIRKRIIYEPELLKSLADLTRHDPKKISLPKLRKLRSRLAIQGVNVLAQADEGKQVFSTDDDEYKSLYVSP